MFLSFLLSIANHSRIMKNHDCILYIYYIYIYISESSVVSAHVLGSLLMPLFSMNLPIQKKNMAALVTSTLHLPQANPKNKIPYTKLNSITENRKKTKKTKKTKIPEKGWGAHSCWIFVFFCFFVFFGFCVFLVVLLIVPPVYRGGFTLKMFSPYFLNSKA